MQMMFEPSDELKARIEAISARTTMSPAELIANVLESGRSLAWYEEFLDEVDAGLAEADRGEFVSDAEIDRVLNKYRPT